MLFGDLMLPHPLCHLFGHRSNPSRYMVVAVRRTIDGIQREHASVFSQCSRCHEDYKVGNVHLPKRMREEYLETALTHANIQLREARTQLAAITLGGM